MAAWLCAVVNDQRVCNRWYNYIPSRIAEYLGLYPVPVNIGLLGFLQFIVLELLRFDDETVSNSTFMPKAASRRNNIQPIMPEDAAALCMQILFDP